MSQVESFHRFSKMLFFIQNISSLPVSGGANREQTGLPKHGGDVQEVD